MQRTVDLAHGTMHLHATPYVITALYWDVTAMHPAYQHKALDGVDCQSRLMQSISVHRDMSHNVIFIPSATRRRVGRGSSFLDPTH